MRTLFQSLLATLASALLLTALPTAAQPAPMLTHVHGLAYSADGAQLMIPSHDGLAVYADGRWRKAAGPQHDYMGFSATRNALYSSGHPAPGSGLVNPFGLIKSTDGGKTWRKLGLEGESDFHLLAASYDGNAVYVANGQPNSRMREAGLYVTLNDGMQWQKTEARGLHGQPNALAVHPKDSRLVAIGTDRGLNLSRDGGGNFTLLVPGTRVLAQSFDLDAQQLWFGAHAGKPMLGTVALQPGAKPDMRPLPLADDDAVAYIAQNPVRPEQLAIASFKKNVYLSADRGQTWQQIAKEGHHAK